MRKIGAIAFKSIQPYPDKEMRSISDPLSKSKGRSKIELYDTRYVAMTSLTPAQAEAVELLRHAEMDTDAGMPEALFLLVSSLIPIPNVDLLVVSRQNQILLARRNDPYYEKNWHIPGGCMRFNESFEQRILETARLELGSTVTFEKTPLAVRNVIRGPKDSLVHPRERGHNVAILFRCFLPEDYEVQNGDREMDDNGYLKWFHRLPEDFSCVQHVYDDILAPWR